MSSNNITKNNGRQLNVNTDTAKIFIYENRSIQAPYNNSAYGAATLVAGTVMGRVTGTGYVKPLDSTFTDGAQVPVGILMEDVVADGGSLQDIALCNYGDVAQEQLVFVNATDNLDTTVTDGGGFAQRMRDRLHNMGIRLVKTEQMSDFDNS